MTACVYVRMAHAHVPELNGVDCCLNRRGGEASTLELSQLTDDQLLNLVLIGGVNTLQAQTVWTCTTKRSTHVLSTETRPHIRLGSTALRPRP